MAKINAVIFDLGGVLVGFKGKDFVPLTHSFIPLSKNVCWNKDTAGIMREFESGYLSPKQFFEKIVPFMKRKMRFKDFCRRWCDFFVFRPKVFRLLCSLKAAGYKVAVLSNTNVLQYDCIAKHYGFKGIIDAVATSFETHSMKPDKKIFGVVSKQLVEKPGNCLYIDDLQIYVDAAIAHGFNAVQYRNIAQLEKSLSMHGVITTIP